MVKHIILWTLKEELSGEQKETIKQGIKEGLEGLSGQIPGLLEISVRTDCLPSSTVDVMLDSTFESAKVLKNYSTHPKHVAVLLYVLHDAESRDPSQHLHALPR